MTNHPFLPVGNRAGRARRPQTLSLLLEWSSFAARAAVRRTCNSVTLRCQRVLARYRPTRDEFEHVAVGDPDPGLTPHHPVCRFEWEDEVSPCFALLWRCIREQGHHGQHVAGTGERVAVVYPHPAQGHCAGWGNRSAPDGRFRLKKTIRSQRRQDRWERLSGRSGFVVGHRARRRGRHYGEGAC